MIQLSRKVLSDLQHAEDDLPSSTKFDLSEKVLQFGTGVLLRGLCDYFISKANDAGIFNGRILIVKSTLQGNNFTFENQDNLYTLCIRGIEEGNEYKENYVCSAISRVLSANEEWKAILESAANKQLRVVISNTTEVGITLVNESIFQEPPASFPAKLLAFLYERFKHFNADPTAGMIIIPTELISNNGKKLQEILNRLSVFNRLETSFLEWLNTSNHFCNSLVDRIVAGKPDATSYKKLQDELGYKDELLAVCEVYCLWAIEGNEYVKSVLSFHKTDDGVIIQPDIESYKALKLHLLNGTHTLTCGLAYLYGHDLVKSGMADELIFSYVSNLMQQDIANAIPFPLAQKVIKEFSLKVLDRFRNPYIDHLWLNITMQYSAKMRMRNVPVLINYHNKFNATPEYMATGFAAYLLFMKSVKKEGTRYYGQRQSALYQINDEQAAYFNECWTTYKDTDDLVTAVLKNTELWDTDLTVLSGFQQSVSAKLKSISENGIAATLDSLR